MSREIIHSSEPNVSRRAPDKYRSNWYNRVNQRSQGNRYNNFRNQQQNREPNPNNRPPFLAAAATSSNISEAVVKFGFWISLSYKMPNLFMILIITSFFGFPLFETKLIFCKRMHLIVFVGFKVSLIVWARWLLEEVFILKNWPNFQCEMK